MVLYRFQCVIRQASDEAVESSLEPAANSGRVFYLRLTVMFHHPYSDDGLFARRHVLETTSPCYTASGELNKLAWEEAVKFMSEIGMPYNAVQKTKARLILLGSDMVRDTKNEGLTVLPVEGFLVLTVPLKIGVTARPMLWMAEAPSNSLQVCSVCLEDMIRGSMVARLPCKHSFHEKCINQWFNCSPTCPICRLHLGGSITSTTPY